MGAFLFQAKTPEGKMVKGEVSAASEAEARVKLRAQRLQPVQLMMKGAVTTKAVSKTYGRVDAKELQVFTRQFAVLIASGVPVVQSLEAMVGGGRSANLNNTLRAIIAEVAQGKRLAETMKKHPQIFDQMYTNLVHAGEESGKLEAVLDRLAGYIEKSVKLKGKLKGAMFYPIAVLAVSFLVISGILWFVIPKFVEIFESSGMALPWLTQKVVDASENFKSYWYLYIGTVIAIPFGLKQYYATADGKRTLDTFFLRIPLFGDLIIKGSVARFSRTMATMLSAGVKIIEAIDIAAGTAGNYVIEQTLLASRESINKGKTFSEPIRKSKILPEMVGQMISVGEQTGSLDAMLDKVANFYEEEVEQATDALTSVIEPIMMVFLGGIVAVLVIAMYLPIFGMAGAATGG